MEFLKFGFQLRTLVSPSVAFNAVERSGSILPLGLPLEKEAWEARHVPASRICGGQSCHFAPLTSGASGHLPVFWTQPNENRRSLGIDTPIVVRHLADHT
jgi:hypothetical protein